MRFAVFLVIHLWIYPWRLVDPFDGVVHLCGQSRWFGVDAVLIDLHKLGRKYLIEVIEATRFAVQESSKLAR